MISAAKFVKFYTRRFRVSKKVNGKVIDALLKPQSIAIIGASNKSGKIGNTIVQKLLEGKYGGKIYPINPKDKEILGLKAYPSILDVPEHVDGAIIAVPAEATLQVVDECGQKGVNALTVITSGFSEVGRTDLEEAMVDKAHSYGMGIMGPNIIGILSNSEQMNASFAPLLPLEGKASLVSQSGALLIALDMATFTRRVGFEKLVSIGNMSDVNFGDLVEWLDQDEKTQCIALYIEGLKKGRHFIEKCRAARKPIVALKAGISEHGAAAAASHTGSLAGAAKVYKAAFDQAGVIMADSVGNLFDRTLAFSLQPPMEGDNLLVITNGGGVGVLASDAAEKCDIPLKFAPKDVQTELKKHMPEFGSAKNPVDITGGAGVDWYYESVKYAYAHKWVDGLVVLYCETAVTDPIEIAEGIHKAITETGLGKKPVVVSFLGGERSDQAMQWLVENDIPAYDAPDKAVCVLSGLRQYAKICTMDNSPFKIYDHVNRDQALNIINKVRTEGRDALTEIEAKQVFAAYGLPVAETRLARTEDEAVELATIGGFPVVMKLVSPDILHKSDAGGVRVNVKNADDVREGFRTIVANAKAYKSDATIIGVAIQEMAPWGTEVIVGSINDPTFGPTIMFGLGGIFVEVLKDVTFRVAPVTNKQAFAMLKDITSGPILDGVRGETRRDQEALATVISYYSQMISDLANEIAETDANPVLVYGEGKGCKIVDARIILKKK
ncbi:MAG: acetate--CoA ligase family protein [Anaerolineales bacterium]|nr:acetate--CoA ligase family protein [Anaerolineales bacterium]